MRQIFDVSLPIHQEMISWPTDPKVGISPFKDQQTGKTSNVLSLRMGTHTGTHIDAPAHFIKGGLTVDELPLSVLIGPVRVFWIDVAGEINRGDLEDLDFRGVGRVFLKTRNSELYRTGSFSREFAYLSGRAADFLLEQGVKLVGIDYLSIDAYGAERAPAHQALLAGGVVIVESIDLSGVESGDYELICMPLRISGGDGAPARVVLVR